MKLKTLLSALSAVLPLTAMMAQTPVAHFDMSLASGSISEAVSHTSYTVVSQLPACTVSGTDGEALRFDGYSNYVKAALPASVSGEALTASVVLAAESYPMMQVDVAETTPTYTAICGNLDETNKQGFAFELSSQGDLRLRMYVEYGGGYLLTVAGNQKLPRGQWNRLDMTYDKSSNAVKLYLNGTEIGTSRNNRVALRHTTGTFYIGKDAKDTKSGPFLINTFCGAIDDIAIYNSVITPAAFTPQLAYMSYPAERYAASLWRPQFHAMPSGSWTNESHGMLYSGGRYHVFFQKNANGPYMSRLHWGHISSENLYEWTEEPIAVAPGESYDIKGCWSGCVTDDGGTPTLYYTAVDNERARIVQAHATDADLLQWTKDGIKIDGRPAGLSDDFRDPYIFTANGTKYLIVGTSKNGIGACTLHRLNGTSWTNDGTLFFQGTSASQHGTFWEMPNVTPMGDGRWLFTCTPLGTGVGVRTLCWVGTIGTDGRFTPDANGVQYLEMGGISRDGFGLLSPTIYQHNGKTLLLGIVPDKLPTQTNYQMGWAHNFSLPREVSLDADGLLVQRPYSGLSAMRDQQATVSEQQLNGTRSLAPVAGRQLELLGEFTVSSGTMGFHFLKSGSQQATLTYEAATGRLTLDLSALQRQSNDGGSYAGIYSATLPRRVAAGGKLKLHVFLDGSIADIFVCDTWAFSVRLFPTDAAATEAEVFTTAPTDVNIAAWTLSLNPQPSSLDPLHSTLNTPPSTLYDLQGRRLNERPQHGIYIMNGRKYVAH